MIRRSRRLRRTARIRRGPLSSGLQALINLVPFGKSGGGPERRGRQRRPFRVGAHRAGDRNHGVFGDSFCASLPRPRQQFPVTLTARKRRVSAHVSRLSPVQTSISWARSFASFRSQATREWPQRKKLLILLTDGKPNDVDHDEGRFAIEDAQGGAGGRRLGTAIFRHPVAMELNPAAKTLSSSRYIVCRHARGRLGCARRATMELQRRYAAENFQANIRRR